MQHIGLAGAVLRREHDDDVRLGREHSLGGVVQPVRDGRHVERRVRQAGQRARGAHEGGAPGAGVHDGDADGRVGVRRAAGVWGDGGGGGVGKDLAHGKGGVARAKQVGGQGVRVERGPRVVDRDVARAAARGQGDEGSEFGGVGG